MKIALLVAATISVATGCMQTNQSPEVQATLQRETAAITSELAAVKAELAALRETQDDVRSQTAVLAARTPSASAFLSPTATGYAIVSTNLFPLLVSFHSIEPLGSGSLVRISIGNAHAVTFRGATIKATAFSDRVDESGSIVSRNIEHKHLQDIFPGTWSQAEIRVDGIKPDAMKFITVEVSLDVVSLR